MPVDKNKLKQNLGELSAKAGGSLVKRIVHSEIAKTGTILFVGLGGMGCATVNEIKKIYSNEFRPTNTVRFIAVDTSEDDLNLISVGAKGGYILPEEKFEVFDHTAIDLLHNPPSEVEAWLGNLDKRDIDNTGAQATRQIGRIMLCGTSKYADLKAKIKENIDALSLADPDPNHPIHVVLIAGISGGTGSGTFIDVSYMINNLLRAKHEAGHPTRAWGCFYTPDVVKSEVQVKDPTKWSSLQNNGYAALKELDYYMTNEGKAGEPIYTLNTPGELVTSTKPIYDPGFAFIVSTNTTIVHVNDIITSTARSLIHMHQDVSQVNPDGSTSFQSILSAYSNVPNDIAFWATSHIGVPVSGAESDPAGVFNTDFPTFMNYVYSSFGYSSVYFPRDEMLAYCANRVMERVIAKWKAVDNLNQKKIAGFANHHKIATIDQILESIKSTLRTSGYKEESLKIDKVLNQQSWPKKIGTDFLGKVTGTNNTMTCANQLAADKFAEFGVAHNIRKVVDSLADNIIKTLNSQQFMSQYGPFVCIAILTGYNGLVGCCGCLDNLLTKVNQTVESSDRYLDQVKATMENEAIRLEGDHNPTGDEINKFIDDCHAYSVAWFDNAVCKFFLAPVIQGVKNKLQAFNNQTYEVFVPVMDTLTEMLQADGTVLVKSEHKEFAGGQSFSMDAYGLLKAAQKRQRFLDVLGQGVDDAAAQKVANLFANSMFSAESREKWLGFQDNPEALAEEIRTIFNQFFRPFAGELLEKYMVLAYNNDPNLKLDAKMLSEIWEAQDGTTEAAIRDAALGQAGRVIAQQLMNESSVMIKYEDGTLLSTTKAKKKHMLLLLAETPNLNQKIISAFGAVHPEVGLIGDDCKSVITAISFVLPVALPLVKGIKDYAQIYYDNSATSSGAGRHLDENSQNWVAYLPELYGIDAVSYYDKRGRSDMKITYPEGPSGAPMNNDDEMYNAIGEAIDYGMRMGYITKLVDAAGSVYGYELLNIIRTKDNYASLFEEYQKMLTVNPDTADWKDAIKTVRDADKKVEYEYIQLKCKNQKLQDKICAIPIEPGSPKNVCRVVRFNMQLEKLILEAKEKYTLLFDRLHDMKLYAERIRTFVQMIVCDIIQNDDVEQQWTYTYSENSQSVLLLNYKGMRNELDEVANIFHAFVTFCREVDDNYYKVICEYLKRLNDGGKLNKAKRDAVVAAIDAVLNHPLFTNPVESEKIEKINELRNESGERFQPLYDMPVKFDGEKSVHDNIFNFYTELKKKLEAIKIQ